MRGRRCRRRCRRRRPWSGSAFPGPSRASAVAVVNSFMFEASERRRPGRRRRRPCRFRRRRRAGRWRAPPCAARSASGRRSALARFRGQSRNSARGDQKEGAARFIGFPTPRRVKVAASPTACPGILHVDGQSRGHRVQARGERKRPQKARRRPPWSSAAAASPAASTRSAPCAPSTCSPSTAPSTTSTSTSAPAPAPSSPRCWPTASRPTR